MINRDALADVLEIIEQHEDSITNEVIFAAAFNRIVNMENQIRELQACMNEMLGAQRNFAQGVEDERI